MVAAAVPKTGAGGDACGARPNWSAIAVYPGKPTSRSPTGRERSEPRVDQGPSHQRAAASPRHRIVGGRLRASMGRGSDEAEAGLVFGHAIHVVSGSSL